jgi:hypothetical protein
MIDYEYEYEYEMLPPNIMLPGRKYVKCLISHLYAGGMPIVCTFFSWLYDQTEKEIRAMKIHRIDHVGVVVTDLAAAKAFFLDLGLEVQGELELE